ncbi:MAG: hypothetical protein QM520_00580 [Gammaproteobacteria bacterium]|nr:hypothetical protein [Gammaproteobacteria bacterium]
MNKPTISKHEVDQVDQIVHIAPIVIPVLGGMLMFLLAFIAVFVA